MDPEDVLRDPPLLHVDGGTGQPVGWYVEPDVLRHLRAALPERAKTAETGAGTSTVFFAACGFEHLAIAPDAALFARIAAWCGERGIGLERVQFVAERSEWFLPRTRTADLDLFLVDGRHGFPTPFLDWFYGAERLKVGGLCAIDDTQILTGRILADFLHTDRHWSDGVEIGKTAIFRKVDRDVHGDEWHAQEFVRRRSGRGGRLSRWLSRTWRRGTAGRRPAAAGAAARASQR
ncbi:MAG TPA: hypothetical protein VK081_02905 [Planctomycetota bacterium]|nr:hypothetical protein [Planctomycetota bacterium]